MNHQPFIAIITPTYNAENFIEKCIKSVQSQTFVDYEHLIIDGMSMDRTVGLVKEFQKEFTNIRLIIEKDRGVFDAMNKGIQSVQSQWLYFLGADDFMYDDKVLEDTFAFMQKNRTSIIYGDVYFEKLSKVYDGKFDVEKILQKNICHQSMFYHESVFKLMGLYDLRYPLAADFEFNLMCWLTGKIKFIYFHRTIAYYAHGGISSIQDDAAFKKDYPHIVLNAVLNGNKNKFNKIYYLSIVFRKIIQRYSIKIFANEFFNGKFFLMKLFSVLFMCLSLPIYAFKKFMKGQ